MGEYLHGIPGQCWRPGREVENGPFHKLHNRDERKEGMMVYESRESSSDSESSLWKFNIVMAADDPLANLDKIEEVLRGYPMLATGSSQRVLIHKFEKLAGNHATDHTLKFRTWKCRSSTIGLTKHKDLTRSGNDRGIRHVYIENNMNTTNESLAQEMANLLCHLVLYTPPFPDAFGGLDFHKGHRVQHLVRSPRPSTPGALPSAPRPPSSSGSRGAAPEPVQIPPSIAPQVRQPLPPQPPSSGAAPQPPRPVKLSTSIPPPPPRRPLAPAAPLPLTAVSLPPPGDLGHVAPAGAATPPRPCVKLPPDVSSILPPSDPSAQGPTQEWWPQEPAKMEVSEIPLGQSVSEVVEVPVAQETPPEPTNSLPSTQEESAIMPSTWLRFAWKSWKPPPSFFARSICHD